MFNALNKASNQSATTRAELATLAELWERTVRSRPSSPAIVSNGEILSYDEVNARANRLARLLLDEGAGPGRLVALALPRSSHMVISVLAVAKAGAAFLPVDVNHPRERISYLLADAGPALLCTIRGAVPKLPADIGVPQLVLDSAKRTAMLNALPDTDMTEDERGGPLAATNLAYVIYTSGSTGRPKGVALTSAGLAALAAAKVATMQVNEDSRVLQFASPSFDAYVTELLAAFTAGATLVLSGTDALAGAPLQKALQDGRVSHAVLPPAAVATMSPDAVPDLRVLVVAGEACPAGLAEQWAPGRLLINAYGPTECTVCATMTGPLTPTDEVTIGRPIPGVSAYILDDELRPAAVGEIGELYLSGAGLARGYLNRPDLTAQLFMANPFAADGERMYRTGDLASMRADGDILFHGRIDDQVELRGFRIELGEVESVLSQHPDVGQAVAVLRADAADGPQLVAYVVPTHGTTPAAGELREHAGRFLPDYMVPSIFATIDAVPLTPGGKTDRARLPEPVRTTRPVVQGPRTPSEKILCDIFRDLFDLVEIDVRSNFFELGGNSILAVNLIQRARQAGLTLLPRTVLDHPTIEQLAAIAALGE
ncbi:amino acid adenylation domain-containing protein [Streptomyces sp. ISL-99]|uniref:amino acid adenylation domain-containing protein n=1 Tax=Streptomyces sp. ISL-99 TaxID=2819193 RepID=UPI001BEAD815|nr:amino acid adenylation domain-containing protein [Streptomyces sp. ISL-99]MBT2528773.1 amino acid adenylation domain-containing protein [Streptomyces sp. ISL-99]